MKLRIALIPTGRHDCGILTPNAPVLIVVFALRLSAEVGGECHVWQVRWMHGEKGEGREVGAVKTGHFKGSYWCVCTINLIKRSHGDIIHWFMSTVFFWSQE